RPVERFRFNSHFPRQVPYGVGPLRRLLDVAYTLIGEIREDNVSGHADPPDGLIMRRWSFRFEARARRPSSAADSRGADERFEPDSIGLVARDANASAGAKHGESALI